jgi:LacI family gluconate utilization system Gnt-I transcriptional repressor
MADVAQIAGVSAITVSRALRAPGSVAIATRERIEQAIEDTGYVFDSVAGSLKSRRTRLVLVIIPSIMHSYLAHMIQGVSDVLSPSGLHMVLGTTEESPEGEERAIGAFLALRPCAILLHNTAHTERTRTELLRCGVPLIETGDLIGDALDHVVSYSNFDAARVLTRHLASRNYRRIAFVYRHPANERTLARRNGYRAALAEAGLKHDARLEVPADPGFAGGTQVIRHLMAIKKPVDAALFVGNDLATAAALECRRKGWDVPGRMAIATYDDNEMAEHMDPGITAVSIPRYELGRRAALVVLESLEVGQLARRTVDVGFELHVRQST